MAEETLCKCYHPQVRKMRANDNQAPMRTILKNRHDKFLRIDGDA
jgi:hypothetical protein